MKAMTRPCRLSSRSLMLHTSSTCFTKSDSSSSLTKPPAQQPDLDFFKAADILFSEEDPRRRKKFGWDFHLWQAFVACLPSVAIYLTAQYARYDMRRMEAERERQAAEKRKVEEQKQEEEARKLPGFRTLHERLDKMEEKISELESKATQSAVASQEGKLETVERNVKVGNADTPAERENGDKRAESVTQNAPNKNEEEPKHNSKDLMKAPEGRPTRGEKLQELPSKAESDEQGEAAKKQPKDLQAASLNEGEAAKKQQKDLQAAHVNEGT